MLLQSMCSWFVVQRINLELNAKQRWGHFWNQRLRDSSSNSSGEEQAANTLIAIAWLAGDQLNSNTGQYAGQHNQQPNSNTVTDIANTYAAAGSASNEWVMDGAATHHIIPHKHAFSSLATTGIPQLTQVAGPTAKAGKGTVRLAVKQPQKQTHTVEVLWVPTAGCQQFSEIRAQRAGARMSAKRESKQIKWPGGVCIQAQLGASSNPIHTKLFTSIAESTNSHAHQAAIACTGQQSAAQLWHRWLGHLSPTSMAQLPGMVKGLNISRQQATALGNGWCAECLSSK